VAENFGEGKKKVLFEKGGGKREGRRQLYDGDLRCCGRTISAIERRFERQKNKEASLGGKEGGRKGRESNAARGKAFKA